MIAAKIRTSTDEEFRRVENALKNLGLERRGAIKGDGFTLYAKFTNQNDEKKG